MDIREYPSVICAAWTSRDIVLAGEGEGDDEDGASWISDVRLASKRRADERFDSRNVSCLVT